MMLFFDIWKARNDENLKELGQRMKGFKEDPSVSTRRKTQKIETIRFFLICLIWLMGFRLALLSAQLRFAPLNPMSQINVGIKDTS